LYPPKRIERRLVESLRLAHGALDVKRTDVLPLLLEQGDEEVDSQHGVGDDLVLVHVNVTDSDGETKNLLKLELDGGPNIDDLSGKVLGVGDTGWEFSSLGKTWTEQTWDLLDQSLGSHEGVVFLSELLDQFLVLVELLQVIDGHVLELDLLGTIDIESIGKNADGHTRTGNVGKLDGTRETLVTLRVVVLETDLELDGLDEVTLLTDSGSLSLEGRLVENGLDHGSHA